MHARGALDDVTDCRTGAHAHECLVSLMQHRAHEEAHCMKGRRYALGCMSLLEPVARLPSRGWVTGPSPVTALPHVARHAGLASLSVKRDDLIEGLHGGTKVRKLDVLFATEPFASAPRIASLGAIGSGHLVACAYAADALHKTLDVHAFFEPLSDGVLENLASVASGPTTLHAYGGRVELALRRPALLLASTMDGVPVIPPGAALPAAIAGVVRGALELAEQVRSGALVTPDVVYCALGTGGTVAGLALGLGLAGLKTEVCAVSTTERIFSSSIVVRRQIAAAARWLRAMGVACDEAQAVRVRFMRDQLGRGYGIATAQSLAAREIGSAEGVPIEPIYTGKAFAGLLADAAAGRAGKHALLWNTVRRGPLPRDPAWRDRLPVRLDAYLNRATTRPSRARRMFVAGSLAALGAVAWGRTSGYAQTAWAGSVLSSWEAEVLAAAAPVLSGIASVEGIIVAANVDRFLIPAAPAMTREIHALLALVEHGTTPLGLRLPRFTRLPPDAREGYLVSMGARGGLLAQAVRGLRDLVLVGTYQHESTWDRLGYRGPWALVPGAPPDDTLRMRAPRGALPRGAA